MARIVKEKEYAVKRNEILDVAQRLIYTKGYEQMTIQDMLDDLQISKGAFYHYFDSKQALLEALIERMAEEAEQLLIPIAHDPHLSALEKLQHFYPTLARWKTARKTFFLALLRVLYADDNAIFRQKMRARAIKQAAPLLAEIIHQGIHEGVLTTTYANQAGELVVSLVFDLGDTIAWLLLSCEPNNDLLRRMEDTTEAYTDALERILGAPTGSVPIVDAEGLKEWVVSPGNNADTKS
ncbi:MAG TPA: TetR/AcrR family transcriptional regulator [Ktedonobacteraceae bacterium]|nr:TetR/AcrR family transcriptional regulator [Ktedonobacteraceae bacterium]